MHFRKIKVFYGNFFSWNIQSSRAQPASLIEIPFFFYETTPKSVYPPKWKLQERLIHIFSATKHANTQVYKYASMQKFWSKKNSSKKKLFRSKKIYKLKKNESKKILGSKKNVESKKKFLSKKMWVQKKFGFQKKFGRKKVLRPKKIVSKNTIRHN